MPNKRFKMFEIRQVLVQMRQGASDRVVAQSGLVGRRKAAWIRKVAGDWGWLNTALPLPEGHGDHSRGSAKDWGGGAITSLDSLENLEGCMKTAAACGPGGATPTLPLKVVEHSGEK